MGLYDRDWTREQDEAQQYGSQMRFGLPTITPAVKWLLIINSVVFTLGWLISDPKAQGDNYFDKAFALYPATLAYTLQVWRLITYQFLHADIGHIIFNMWMLLIVGPLLERQWGAKKFIIFYLFCGIAGGLFYIFLAYIRFLHHVVPMVGSSGSILGVLTACAILLPRERLFIFPLPISVSIRIIAIGYFCWALLTIIFKGENVGGEAAHFAGIAAGAIYVFSDKWRTNLKLRFKAFRWDRHLAKERKLHIEVDRILKKVHDSGMHSLTASEKRILKKATKLEQTRKKL